MPRRAICAPRNDNRGVRAPRNDNKGRFALLAPVATLFAHSRLTGL
ncbi:MAG: hypothetical protein LBL66_10430 [Clostridiales bacterium]|nr:hypothetical protein [Clostridiales bacterium]